jgi:hypothetical protein
MALIFRSLVEVEASDFVDAAPDLFLEWLRRKLRTPVLEMTVDGVPVQLERGNETCAVAATDGGATAFRGHLFERRPTEQVKTTFTAISGDGSVWAWVDLERWSEDAWERTWVPYAPAIVSSVLGAARCYRGPTGLDGTHHVVAGQRGSLLARQVLDPSRVLPLVVASPTSEELADDMTPALERAVELQRRLAGVAPVYVLTSGAVESFSIEMLRGGEGMDVHSGAVRVYLPRAGGPGDDPGRHRYIPFGRVSRYPDSAARLIAPELLRAASHQAPPPHWAHLRSLPEFASGVTRDEILAELLVEAERERDEAISRADSAETGADEATERADYAEEFQDELLTEQDALRRRVRYVEGKLRETGETVDAEPTDEAFAPASVEDVLHHARSEFGHLVFGPKVDGGVAELDDQIRPAWARKALLALRALQAFAEAAGSGFAGDFRAFCESDTMDCVPTSWVAMRESEATDNNKVFRQLRTFAVDPGVSESGLVYMPAHIKLDRGGYPAPRIHFHDDTGGATGKIHIGWIGPHLASQSTN